MALQVNSAVWLREVAGRVGRAVTLLDVPPAEWDALVPRGIDLVWLLGVWERSDIGRSIALADPVKLAEIGTALPDWSVTDVLGSPFSIREYVPRVEFGGWNGVDAARSQLAARGARLMLDWVPNHMGPDSPWLRQHPEAFMAGTATELQDRPEEFLAVADGVFARGRDPYFPPWPDVVQVNPFSPQLRELAGRTLARIAEHCDAVRADMAMLMLDDVVGQVWGARAGAPLATGYWQDVMRQARSANPDLRYVAEVYWGREPDLQALGFQYCYDKPLLDILEADDPASLRRHLSAEPGYQSGLVRFIENHDESRAAVSLLPWERQRAASIVASTVPGLTLWHEGQAEGRRVWLPVFLARRPDEPLDQERLDFHRQLWQVAAVVRRGQWRLLDVCDCRGAPALAWCWGDGANGSVSVVVVNYGNGRSQGTVELGQEVLWEEPSLAADEAEWSSEGSRLAVNLGPWGYLVLPGVAAPG